MNRALAAAPTSQQKKRECVSVSKQAESRRTTGKEEGVWRRVSGVRKVARWCGWAAPGAGTVSLPR